jgi:hypothetical protein
MTNKKPTKLSKCCGAEVSESWTNNLFKNGYFCSVCEKDCEVIDQPEMQNEGKKLDIDKFLEDAEGVGKILKEKETPTPTKEEWKEIETIESELAIFWDNFANVLPKSRARSEIGDEKLFVAFKDTYLKIREHLLSQKDREIIDMIEKESNDIQEFEYDGTNGELINRLRAELLSIQNKIKSLLKPNK